MTIRSPCTFCFNAVGRGFTPAVPLSPDFPAALPYSACHCEGGTASIPPCHCEPVLNGDPTKMNDLCGEKEKPRYRRNFLLAENVALYLALRRRGNPYFTLGYYGFPRHSLRSFLGMTPYFVCHCEERSDVAIRIPEPCASTPWQSVPPAPGGYGRRHKKSACHTEFFKNKGIEVPQLEKIGIAFF